MSNELARNQTPNNWISSYINIFQEYQKIQNKKRMVEEAQRQSEMVQSGDLGELEEVQFTMPSSPEYSASSPVYGQQLQAQPIQQFGSFVPAQVPAPGYMMPQVLQPVQVKVPVPVQPAAAAVPVGSILSVAPPVAASSESSGSGSGEQNNSGKKLVTLNL